MLAQVTDPNIITKDHRYNRLIDGSENITCTPLDNLNTPWHKSFGSAGIDLSLEGIQDPEIKQNLQTVQKNIQVLYEQIGKYDVIKQNHAKDSPKDPKALPQAHQQLVDLHKLLNESLTLSIKAKKKSVNGSEVLKKQLKMVHGHVPSGVILYKEIAKNKKQRAAVKNYYAKKLKHKLKDFEVGVRGYGVVKKRLGKKIQATKDVKDQKLTNDQKVVVNEDGFLKTREEVEGNERELGKNITKSKSTKSTKTNKKTKNIAKTKRVVFTEKYIKAREKGLPQEDPSLEQGLFEYNFKKLQEVNTDDAVEKKILSTVVQIQTECTYPPNKNEKNEKSYVLSGTGSLVTHRNNKDDKNIQILDTHIGDLFTGVLTAAHVISHNPEHTCSTTTIFLNKMVNKNILQQEIKVTKDNILWSNISVSEGDNDEVNDFVMIELLENQKVQNVSMQVSIPNDIQTDTINNINYMGYPKINKMNPQQQLKISVGQALLRTKKEKLGTAIIPAVEGMSGGGIYIDNNYDTKTLYGFLLGSKSFKDTKNILKELLEEEMITNQIRLITKKESIPYTIKTL